MALKDTVTRILITAKDETSGVFGTLQRNAGKVAAAIVGFFSVKLFAGAADSAEALDLQMRKLDAAIEATGGAAGLTAEEIDQMARRLDEATLGSAEGFRDAAAKLLTFKNVGKDSFETVLELAQDLADTGFGTLDTNITQLGKALEDPIKGMTALARSGVSFSRDQEAVIRSLVETGRAAEAQGLILEAVSGQVGGVARSMGTGLSGAVDLVKARFTELQQQLGAAILPSLQKFNERIADLYGRLRDSGAVEKFGEVIATVFESAQQAAFKFLDTLDLDAVIAKLREWAAATQETVAQWAGYMSTASSAAIVAFGAIGTGINTIKTAFFGVAGVVATFAQNMTGAFATVIEAVNRVTGKFGEAATEVRAISDAFGESARQNFANAAGALDDTAVSAERLRDSFSDLISPAESSAEALKLAADSTEDLNASAELTADKLDALGEGFEFIDGQAKKAAAGIKSTADAADGASGSLSGATDDALDLAAAYKELGVTSSEELRKAADRAKEAFDRIKASGTASVEDIQRAFRVYADRAIAANDGVADSTVQASASLVGLRVQADETGKIIVTAMNAAAAATREVAGEAANAAVEYRGLADAADAAGEAIERASSGPDRRPGRTAPGQSGTQLARMRGVDVDYEDVDELDKAFNEAFAKKHAELMKRYSTTTNVSRDKYIKDMQAIEQAALAESLQRIKDRAKKELEKEESAPPSRTGGSGITQRSTGDTGRAPSSGISGPISITINDARDPEKVARLVKKELDKIQRFAR